MDNKQCMYCDEYGFCKRYSNAVTVWKCNICEEYEEAEDGE